MSSSSVRIERKLDNLLTRVRKLQEHVCLLSEAIYKLDPLKAPSPLVNLSLDSPLHQASQTCSLCMSGIQWDASPEGDVAYRCSCRTPT